MSPWHLVLTSLADTVQFGRMLGQTADPGDIICLDGDLGAGKTTLCQAIARGLEVPESTYVTSPSFALLHQYEGRLTMFHMDFYRLENVDEVAELGFDEYYLGSGLTVIEWSRRAAEILPPHKMEIDLHVTGPFSRRAEVKAPRSLERKVDALLRVLM